MTLSHTLRELSTTHGRIPYAVIRSSRRRTMEIAIPSSSHAKVTVPRFVTEETIEQFLSAKSSWIIRKIGEKKKAEEAVQGRSFAHGQEFLFLGKKYPLDVRSESVSRKRISFDGQGWKIHLGGDASPSLIKKHLVQWYRREAGELFASRVFHFSRLMSLEPQIIAIKTQKRLWGSCNPRRKSINLNWLLIMAPLDVLDSVIVHELCHLKVPNHSHRFWKAVEQILPDYREREQWLKTHAAEMFLPPVPAAGRNML